MEKYLIFRPGLSVSLFSHEKALLLNADETLGIRFESLSYKTFDDVTTNMSKRGKYISLTAIR